MTVNTNPHVMKYNISSWRSNCQCLRAGTRSWSGLAASVSCSRRPTKSCWDISHRSLIPVDLWIDVSPAPLLGWWAPRLAPVPSPAHTPVRRAPAAPPWAPGWIKKLRWIKSAKMSLSTCSCSFLLGRRSCSSSLEGFFLLCMGFCENNIIDGTQSTMCSFLFSGLKKFLLPEKQRWLFTCCGPCHHVLPCRRCSSRP